MNTPINIPDPSERSFSGHIFDTGASPYVVQKCCGNCTYYDFSSSTCGNLYNSEFINDPENVCDDWQEA